MKKLESVTTLMYFPSTPPLSKRWELVHAKRTHLKTHAGKALDELHRLNLCDKWIPLKTVMAETREIPMGQYTGKVRRRGASRYYTYKKGKEVVYWTKNYTAWDYIRTPKVQRALGGRLKSSAPWLIEQALGRKLENDEYVLEFRSTSKYIITQWQANIRFSLGACGAEISAWPIESIPWNYLLLKLNSWSTFEDSQKGRDAWVSQYHGYGQIGTRRYNFYFLPNLLPNIPVVGLEPPVKPPPPAVVTKPTTERKTSGNYAKLLLSYGFKLYHEVKGSNPRRGGKVSTLKSFWEHPTRKSTLEINYLTHRFEYREPGMFPSKGSTRGPKGEMKALLDSVT